MLDSDPSLTFVKPTLAGRGAEMLELPLATHILASSSAGEQCKTANTQLTQDTYLDSQIIGIIRPPVPSSHHNTVSTPQRSVFSQMVCLMCWSLYPRCYWSFLLSTSA